MILNGYLFMADRLKDMIWERMPISNRLAMAFFPYHPFRVK